MRHGGAIGHAGRGLLGAGASLPPAGRDHHRSAAREHTGGPARPHRSHRARLMPGSTLARPLTFLKDPSDERA
ncbi:hypothetical protein VARIO8X_50405 [Burkholderiales bacterium 8X]|nr:hypothetical protein VARIO8X_50405 [Burkholderiales bacterium 8X]